MNYFGYYLVLPLLYGNCAFAIYLKLIQCSGRKIKNRDYYVQKLSQHSKLIENQELIH